jgi:hypothetical protein
MKFQVPPVVPPDGLTWPPPSLLARPIPDRKGGPKSAKKSGTFGALCELLGQRLSGQGCQPAGAARAPGGRAVRGM